MFRPVGNVDIGFWSKFAKLKVEEFKLDDSDKPLYARCALSHKVDSVSIVMLDVHSFRPIEPPVAGPFEMALQGLLHCTNTIEEYRNLSDAKLNQMVRAQAVSRSASAADKEGLDLNFFLLAMFADLKKYIFEYRFVANAVSLVGHKVLDWAPAASSKLELKPLAAFIKKNVDSHGLLPFTLLKLCEGGYQACKFSEMKSAPEEDYLFLLLDTINNPEGHGPFLNNYLAFLLTLGLSKEALGRVRVVLFKEFVVINLERPIEWGRSVLAEFDLAGAQAHGEEMLLGGYKPISLDLKPMMDEKTLAGEAIDLNIKLMKWRLLPELRIEVVSGTRCLLFGAGTLGCQLARNLVGWGVRKITFVDNGRVSYSNPVRQSLYTFEDSTKGGKHKAETAAEAMRAIFPGLDATGHTVSVPMPGHFVSTEADIQRTLQSLDLVERLVEEHDAVFLLMDSREARWLPTVLANKYGRICITVALGFDSYVVIRHGVSPKKFDPARHRERLGCYFCNDVLAPVNSMSDRTLDQQCTVTRPGLSYVSSGLASELLVNLLHHPEREGCPASDSRDKLEETELGKVPHHIRGTMSDFNVNLYYGKCFDQCIACSEFVLDQYLKCREKFILEIINNPKYVHEVTNLKEMLEQADYQCVEIDDEDILLIN